MLYLSVIVLIPLAAVVAKSLELGLDQFWTAITNEQALAALKLTVDRLLHRGRHQRPQRAR